MRVPVGFSIALAVGLTIAPPASAELRQFGNVIFPAVPGWSDPGGDGYVSMVSELPDDRCEFCRIMVGPGAAARGSLTGWLNSNRLAFVDEDERAAFEVLQPAETSNLGTREAAMMAISDGSEMQFLVAIRAGSEFALTGFRAYHGSSEPEEVEDNLNVMTSTYLPWLALLRFRSEGAPSLLPPPKPGGMDGLWWGTRTDTSLGMDMMMRTDISHRRIMFWPDGTFYDGTAPQGTAPPDRAALEKALLTEWGNYTDQGDTVRLNFVDGHSEDLERDGESLSGWGYEMYPVTPLADGTRLDGGISWIYYTGFAPNSGVTGGISASNHTTFHPDGRYSGASSGGAFGGFDSGGGYAVNNENADGGTYEIRDGLVIFSPAQGGQRRARAVFRSGEHILIGDQFFEGTAR